VRLFLAIDLPSATRQRIATLQRELGERCAGWRWVRPESIHLTLRFLGQVTEDVDLSMRPDWARAAAGVAPFPARVEQLGVFPPRGRPRILWLGVQDLGAASGLDTLARSLELAARSAGFAADEREFRPHLTLARAAGHARLSTPTDRGWVDPQPFEVRELVLFRSELHPTGARYTALARFPLGEESVGTDDAAHVRRRDPGSGSSGPEARPPERGDAGS